MVRGKKPNIFEKLWASKLGATLCCLLVREASSRATTRPAMETTRAASFRRGGMVIIGVLRGKMFEVINNPATMLPQASRLIGLSTEGLFSLIGESGRNRGCPSATR